VSGTTPLVTVALAVADGERYVRAAVLSVLRQSLGDLELIVVDDGSTDATADILAGFDDERVRVIRHDERRGLAASLNRALEEARGRYVARLDADDVALPRRLERQVKRIQSEPRVAVVGTAALELDEQGRLGALHRMPPGATAVRWAALFGSPFLHPSVLVDREALERHGLGYDPEFLESEDYDLWARLLAVEDGDNLDEPLLLYRTHAAQASRRRGDLQQSLQRRVALREIARVAPQLDERGAELAWRVGTGRGVPPDEVADGTHAFVGLLDTFEAAYGHASGVREAAARALARTARGAGAGPGARALAAALRLDPALAPRAAGRRAVTAARRRGAAREAQDVLVALSHKDEHRAAPAATNDSPVRVAAVFPEPTPYRAPLLDLVAEQPGIELAVIYAADTVARRTWAVEPRHDARFLRGARVPGAWRLFRHDYPVTPGITRALSAAGPEAVVVSGWSTFAAQAAIVWCRARRIPYVLVVESHDEDPRPGWRRALKGAVVPRVVREAAGVLVTGSLARRSMVSRGADPDRVGVFANTIDVEAFAARAQQLAAERDRLRSGLGVEPEDVVVLSVARLAREKGVDVLVRAAATAQVPQLVLVVAGDGPERHSLEQVAGEQRVRAVFLGDVAWERIAELYVAADVFALLSEREPWGVVVNEAAACGLPLVLSDRVGAAADLLRHGENGLLVPAGDVEAAADALRRLAEDDALRVAFGTRSREIVAGWGYGPSVEAFVAAVRVAVPDGSRR
jgi:glycosyltransferase involved in cell wall biosynthesis